MLVFIYQGIKNAMKKLQHFFHTIFTSQTVKPSLLAILFVLTCTPLFAQTVEVKNAGVYYGGDSYCKGVTTSTTPESYVLEPKPTSNRTSDDPWVSSALIEYDQPYPTPTSTGYPNHCLGLCAQFSCNNYPIGQSTYSVAFPIQRVTFDVFKYYNGKNPKNPDETPTIRSIDYYPQDTAESLYDVSCGSYKCYNAGQDSPSATATCVGAARIVAGVCGLGTSANCATECTFVTASGGNCLNYHCCPTYAKNGDTTLGYTLCAPGPGNSNCIVFNGDGRRSLGDPAGTNSTFSACTPWDGFYEIAGEFGKSNGNYGFRATAYTNAPSDGIIADRIEIEEVAVYPGVNQIPIQVDVTNVHTVRSTPSLVGTITPVSAQPYTFTYRLSKDADVRIAIFDASTLDNASYAYATVPGSENSSNETSFASNYTNATDKIVRTLVDWQPRTGEGIKGTEKDTQVSDFDSWDGRDDSGMLLPAGNYIASIQAKAQDEWPGIDFSRAVTRQVSLDPLKLTDVRVVGLNKKSTAYATISYVPTESATVYWEVYTPGTTFDTDNTVSDVLTNSASATGTGPAFTNGTLVFRSQEQKSGRMAYTDRWDGTCQATTTDTAGKVITANCTRTYTKNEKMSNGRVCVNTTCTETFANGAPMPDGNYIYVLWAEIPYNGYYRNAAGVSTYTVSGKTYHGAPTFTTTPCDETTDNNKCFTGVKTLKYTMGTLELERGLVGITMQPASYATLGSSPTAYGLDPFIFKYALDRDAQVVATVENTAGVVVKHLTLQEGEPNVSQQLNTLTWDGRDDQGRMVYPGTYMFRVRANDAMFPAQSNEAIEIFPVDMYRVVDLATTDVYGDSNAKATISYHLSKTMNAQINIYNKDVVIPNYNGLTGEYSDYKVEAVYSSTAVHIPATAASGLSLQAGQMTLVPTGGVSATNALKIPTNGSLVEYATQGTAKYRNTWTAAEEYKLDPTKYRGDDGHESSQNTYTVYLKQEKITLTGDNTSVWPPHICSTDDATYGREKAKDIFTQLGGTGTYYVDPVKVNQYQAKCLYVNDQTFTNYPTTAQAQAGVVDVRLQPIHTFDRSKLSTGDDVINMEEWDALYFYNPTPSAEKHTAAEIAKCTGATEKANCPYEMVPDGQYPFYISARSNEPFSRYYYDAVRDAGNTAIKGTYTLSGQPFVKGSSLSTAYADNIDVQQEDHLYASDKVVSKINVTRGPVYFLDDSVQVYPNAPQLFNASSTTLTFIPPYEINFAISRAATVEVAIVALEPNVCSPVTDNVKSSTVNVFETWNNQAGDICKFLSTVTIPNTGHFDANAIRKTYWDGTDHNGNYVKPGVYEVRLTARNYPDAGLYQPTVKSITLNADLLKVFDLLEADNYSISTRGQDMRIGYQVSVPMKVAIQIFKPGTTIYDYSKGTLRNPATGQEVKDINEVLVRSIVGIRPGTTLIEEVWDGLDYAQQEVPDGVYPFRFVTSLDSAAIDTVSGEIVGDWASTDGSTDSTKWKIRKVADTYEYQNLHKATIAIGDGRFVCEDWQKTVFFYPNPLREASKGTLEITKMPVPGTVSIKYFNLAGDLVRDSDYTCVDANNYQTTMGKNLYFQPDNNVSNIHVPLDSEGNLTINNVRNAALRCKWDRTNQHGKKVARGVYFGLIDFKAFNGREHCQKVVKILIP